MKPSFTKSKAKLRRTQYAPSSTYIKPKNLLLSKAVGEDGLKKNSLFLPEHYLHDYRSLKGLVDKVALSHQFLSQPAAEIV